MNQRRLIFVFLLIFLNGYSQTPFDFGLRISKAAQWSLMSFEEGQYVSNAVRFGPGFSFRNSGYGLYAVYKKRYKLHLGLSNVLYGYDTRYTVNYIGGRRFASTSRSSMFTGVRQKQLSFCYFPKSSRKILSPYFRLGVNYMNIKTGFGYLGEAWISNPLPDGTSDTTVFIDKMFTPVQKVFLLTSGAGVNLTILKRVQLGTELTYFHGFDRLYSSTVEYSVKGEKFENKIYGKGSSIGIDFSLGFLLYRSKEISTEPGK